MMHNETKSQVGISFDLQPPSPPLSVSLKAHYKRQIIDAAVPKEQVSAAIAHQSADRNLMRGFSCDSSLTSPGKT